MWPIGSTYLYPLHGDAACCDFRSTGLQQWYSKGAENGRQGHFGCHNWGGGMLLASNKYVTECPTMYRKAPTTKN